MKIKNVFLKSLKIFLFGKSMKIKNVFSKNNFVRKINGFKNYMYIIFEQILNYASECILERLRAP